MPATRRTNSEVGLLANVEETKQADEMALSNQRERDDDAVLDDTEEEFLDDAMFGTDKFKPYSMDYKKPPAKMKCTSLQYLRSKFNNCTDDEDVASLGKFLFGVLLKMKPSKEDNKGLIYYRSAFDAKNNKKQKKETNAYKRLYVFGSLPDTGLTFTIIDRTDMNAHDLWAAERTRKDVTVGSRFIIYEPHVLGILPNDSVLLETAYALQMIKLPRMPHVVLDSNHVGCNERFFVLKQVRIKTGMLNFVRTSHCTGTLCDRQVEIDGKCACFAQTSRSKGKNNSFVINFGRVSVTDDKAETSASNFKSEPFQSLKTTMLLFKDRVAPDHSLDTWKQVEVALEVREKWAKIVEYINNNGKWVIAGWFKRGDIAAVDGTDIAETVKHHIVFCYPLLSADIESLPRDSIFTPTEIDRILNPDNNESRHSRMNVGDY